MTQQFTIQNYQQQLDQKVVLVTEMMAAFSHPKLEIYPSPISHYRMRAEFRIWHEGDEIYHVMYDPHSRQRLKIDTFPVASQLINQAMPLLISGLKQSLVLRHKLFQVDYLSTLSNQLLITLIYHKKLDEAWILDAKKLKQLFSEQGIDLQLVGRAAKQKINLDHDYVEETLIIEQKPIIYRQVENSFTQPNASINIKMLEWALEVTRNATGDLLELYCGNGNFSLALARNFNQVLATEIAKSSVQSAQYNIQTNHINNVTILRMSAEEFTEALQGKREFNRLKGINLQDYQCNTVLVDPPRSGLDINTLKIIQQYDRIIYISCNPVTLKENLLALNCTHHIEKFAVFDQFPYTKHLECGVVLVKNGQKKP